VIDQPSPSRYDPGVVDAHSLHQSDVPARLHLQLFGHVCFYGWKDIDVLLWQAAPDVASVQQIGEAIPERMERNRHKLSVVHVLYPHVGLPNQQARSELSRIGKRWRDSIVCIGLVVEGGGLRLSAWRGVLTGIIAVSPVRRTVSVAATTAGIASWLSVHHAQKTGVQHTQDELSRMLERVRAAHP
jgi:hypothetical protein